MTIFWGLKQSCSTLSLALAPHLLLSDQLGLVGPRQDSTAAPTPIIFGKGGVVPGHPCLALYWRLDCIRDFLGKLLSSWLAGPCPTLPQKGGVLEWEAAGQGLVLISSPSIQWGLWHPSTPTITYLIKICHFFSSQIKISTNVLGQPPWKTRPLLKRRWSRDVRDVGLSVDGLQTLRAWVFFQVFKLG